MVSHPKRHRTSAVFHLHHIFVGRSYWVEIAEPTFKIQDLAAINGFVGSGVDNAEWCAIFCRITHKAFRFTKVVTSLINKGFFEEVACYVLSYQA
jgi:hypothetical protein